MQPCLTPEVVEILDDSFCPTLIRAPVFSWRAVISWSMMSGMQPFHKLQQRSQHWRAKSQRESKRHKDPVHKRESCGILEGSKQDSEMQQDWIACERCMGWYHDNCAEMNGIMDDNYFTCKTCFHWMLPTSQQCTGSLLCQAYVIAVVAVYMGRAKCC